MDELLRAGFAALGLPLDAAALARFQTYYTLLDERSKVMNLTAIHGETDVAQLHFLDSAADAISSAIENAVDCGSYKLVVAQLEGLEAADLRNVWDTSLYGRVARYRPHTKGWRGVPGKIFALPIDIYFISRYEDNGLIGCISAY